MATEYVLYKRVPMFGPLIKWQEVTCGGRRIYYYVIGTQTYNSLADVALAYDITANAADQRIRSTSPRFKYWRKVKREQ